MRMKLAKRASYGRGLGAQPLVGGGRGPGAKPPEKFLRNRVPKNESGNRETALLFCSVTQGVTVTVRGP